MQAITSLPIKRGVWVWYRCGDVYVVSRIADDGIGERHWTLTRDEYLDNIEMFYILSA